MSDYTDNLEYDQTDSSDRFSEYEDSVASPTPSYIENASSAFANSSKSNVKRKPTCFSKNAISARENRMKKKMYLESLEQNVKKLSAVNKHLRAENAQNKHELLRLKKELKYFKNVVSNSEDIAKILTSIHRNTGLPTTSSLRSERRFDTENDDPLLGLDQDVRLPFDMDIGLPSDQWNNVNSTVLAAQHQTREDHSYTLAPEEDAGICLHIAKHRVCVEHCFTCSESAQKTWNTQKDSN